jgi:hypothetical protein
MPSKTFKFARNQTTTSLGRNGSLITTGLEIGYHAYNPNYPYTNIRPITSRGSIGQCAIEIPAADCPFRALDALIEKTGPKNLPTLMGIHPLLDHLIDEALSGRAKGASQ